MTHPTVSVGEELGAENRVAYFAIAARSSRVWMENDDDLNGLRPLPRFFRSCSRRGHIWDQASPIAH